MFGLPGSDGKRQNEVVVCTLAPVEGVFGPFVTHFQAEVDEGAVGDCTEEDFLYVPVANANGMYAAVVLYRGQLSPYFTSRVSLVDVKTQGDAWIAKNLDGATTIGNVLASVESNPGRLPGMVVNILKTIAAQ